MSERGHGRTKCLAKVAVVATIFCIAFTCPLSASAADIVAPADLEAATRTLGFLDSLQHSSAVAIGVVYGAGVRDGKTAAQRAATTLAGMPGPGSSTLRAAALSVDELAQNSQHFDVLYLMPGIAPSAGTIADYVRRQHVVSISSDPACLAANSCVLMVQAGASVNITLDTALADAAGARFASVFTMMVKRK